MAGVAEHTKREQVVFPRKRPPSSRFLLVAVAIRERSSATSFLALRWLFNAVREGRSAAWETITGHAVVIGGAVDVPMDRHRGQR